MRKGVCTVVICQLIAQGRADTRDTFFGEDSDGSNLLEALPLDTLYT